MSSDFEEYEKAKSRYESMRRRQPDLMDSLDEQIDDYAAGRTVINSTKAGADILPGWDRVDDFNRQVGELSAQIFGIALAENRAKAGWSSDKKKVAGKMRRFYYAPNSNDRDGE